MQKKIVVSLLLITIITVGMVGISLSIAENNGNGKGKGKPPSPDSFVVSINNPLNESIYGINSNISNIDYTASVYPSFTECIWTITDLDSGNIIESFNGKDILGLKVDYPIGIREVYLECYYDGFYRNKKPFHLIDSDSVFIEVIEANFDLTTTITLPENNSLFEEGTGTQLNNSIFFNGNPAGGWDYFGCSWFDNDIWIRTTYYTTGTYSIYYFGIGLHSVRVECYSFMTNPQWIAYSDNHRDFEVY